MRVIYLGTPQFALAPLKSIFESSHTVAAVVCQKDKPNARGNKVNLSPVKEFALEKGIPVLQYGKIRLEGVEELKAVNADIMVTCAYGQILSQEILDITKHGVINIHASLLPKYRGSSPVQRAIINGEKVIGVTVMKTVLALDAGDMILKREITLGNENSGEALDRLSVLGAEMITEALDLIESGRARFEKQDESQASYHPMLKKEDGKTDFSLDATAQANFIRGMNPWPGAFCNSDYGILKLLSAELADDGGSTLGYGTVLDGSPKTGLVVKCSSGAVKITRLQAENAKALSAEEFLRGKPVKKGSRLW